jgi:hypothetical protein
VAAAGQRQIHGRSGLNVLQASSGRNRPGDIGGDDRADAVTEQRLPAAHQHGSTVGQAQQHRDIRRRTSLGELPGLKGHHQLLGRRAHRPPDRTMQVIVNWRVVGIAADLPTV